MAPRPPIALLEDVLRLYDAHESIDDLTSTQKGLIRDAISDISADLEFQTGQAFRLTREGSPNSPETFEYQGIEGNHRRPPVRVILDYSDVLPFDSNQNDTVEYRSGRDEWTEITDQEGDEFTLNYRDGSLKIYRWLINQIVWDVPDDRYLRLTYRHGALGGSQYSGGQTTIDGSIDASDTSVSVSNAGRLPSNGLLKFYDGEFAEYVQLDSVDYDTDTLTVRRGERETTNQGFDDGDVVHFAPEPVIMVVAGKTAQEMQEYEFFTDLLVDTGDGIGASDRVETWADRYDRLLAKTSRVRKL